MKKSRFLKPLFCLSLLLWSLSIQSQAIASNQETSVEEKSRVIVKKDQSEINLRDIELVLHAEWNPEDHFVSAADKDGNSLKIDDLSVISNVNTHKEGIYDVEFSFDNKIAMATVTVKKTEENKLKDKHKNYYNHSTPVILNEDLFEEKKEVNLLTSGGKDYARLDLMAYYLSGTLLFGQRGI